LSKDSGIAIYRFSGSHSKQKNRPIAPYRIKMTDIPFKLNTGAIIPALGLGMPFKEPYCAMQPQ
jgi:hypothetical protein